MLANGLSPSVCVTEPLLLAGVYTSRHLSSVHEVTLVGISTNRNGFWLLLASVGALFRAGGDATWGTLRYIDGWQSDAKRDRCRRHSDRQFGRFEIGLNLQKTKAGRDF